MHSSKAEAEGHLPERRKCVESCIVRHNPNATLHLPAEVKSGSSPGQFHELQNALSCIIRCLQAGGRHENHKLSDLGTEGNYSVRQP